LESAIKAVSIKEMGVLKAGIGTLFHITHTFFEMVKFKMFTLP